MRTFEYSDSKSSKFWNIDLSGTQFTVTYGKVGSKGQTKTKEFDTEEQAEKEHDKLIAAKTKKGYTETTPAPTPVETPLLKALEDDLVENPDDLATHSARADYLIEQGDPRGEFAQVQLALDQPNIPSEERDRLRKREAALLKKHERAWLGDVGRFLLGDWSGPGMPWQHGFSRGWLDSVRLNPYPVAAIESLAKSPEARLVTDLQIVYDMHFHPWEFDQFWEPITEVMREDEGELDPDETFEAVEIMQPLLDSPYLRNLRSFHLGYDCRSVDSIGYTTQVLPFDASGKQITQFMNQNRRLEELYLNDSVSNIEELFSWAFPVNLRVLQYYFGFDGARNDRTGYPLRVLANNPDLRKLTTLNFHAGRDTEIRLDEIEALLASENLTNLTHLQIHMTTFGDSGVPVIIDSGILKRLRVLDIGYGNLTDAGARRLAECPDLKNLERLGVAHNNLTQDGIDALVATGVALDALDQREPGDDLSLFSVDWE